VEEKRIGEIKEDSISNMDAIFLNGIFTTHYLVLMIQIKNDSTFKINPSCFGIK